MVTYSIVGQKHRGLDPYLAGTLPGTDVVLIREPGNKFDPNAVMVWIDGKHVGYIPSRENAALAKFIDQDGLELPFQTAVIDTASVAVGNIAVRLHRGIHAKFARSPNSGYPMVEV